MQNIHDIIEIKRGLHRICGQILADAIAELDKCEEFYQDVFSLYGVIYNTETMKQKRVFVATTAKYFILDRFPEGSLSIVDDKYEPTNKKEIKKFLKNIIEEFFTLRNTYSSNDDFKKKYAEHFNEEVKNFSKEIAENRDDSLSDFVKALEKVYYYKDKNDNC